MDVNNHQDTNCQLSSIIMESLSKRDVAHGPPQSQQHPNGNTADIGNKGRSTLDGTPPPENLEKDSDEQKPAVVKEMVGGCVVCGQDEGYIDNVIIYCDGDSCGIGVHEACYGIRDIPKNEWYCAPCEVNFKPDACKCELCPAKYGAFKPTTNGKWCHVVCALYIPEVGFGCKRTMEPIMLERIEQRRIGNVCILCEMNGRDKETSKSGCSMECHYPNCRNKFHVTCAQYEGNLCEETSASRLRYRAYCPQHIEKFKNPRRTKIKVLPRYCPENPNRKQSNSFLTMDDEDDNDPSRPSLNLPSTPSSSVSSISPVMPQAKNRPGNQRVMSGDLTVDPNKILSNRNNSCVKKERPRKTHGNNDKQLQHLKNSPSSISSSFSNVDRSFNNASIRKSSNHPSFVNIKIEKDFIRDNVNHKNLSHLNHKSSSNVSLTNNNSSTSAGKGNPSRPKESLKMPRKRTLSASSSSSTNSSTSSSSSSSTPVTNRQNKRFAKSNSSSSGSENSEDDTSSDDDSSSSSSEDEKKKSPRLTTDTHVPTSSVLPNNIGKSKSTTGSGEVSSTTVSLPELMSSSKFVLSEESTSSDEEGNSSHHNNDSTSSSASEDEEKKENGNKLEINNSNAIQTLPNNKNKRSKSDNSSITPPIFVGKSTSNSPKVKKRNSIRPASIDGPSSSSLEPKIDRHCDDPLIETSIDAVSTASIENKTITKGRGVISQTISVVERKSFPLSDSVATTESITSSSSTTKKTANIEFSQLILSDDGTNDDDPEEDEDDIETNDDEHDDDFKLNYKKRRNSTNNNTSKRKSSSRSRQHQVLKSKNESARSSKNRGSKIQNTAPSKVRQPAKQTSNKSPPRSRSRNPNEKSTSSKSTKTIESPPATKVSKDSLLRSKDDLSDSSLVSPQPLSNQCHHSVVNTCDHSSTLFQNCLSSVVPSSVTNQMPFNTDPTGTGCCGRNLLSINTDPSDAHRTNTSNGQIGDNLLTTIPTLPPHTIAIGSQQCTSTTINKSQIPFNPLMIPCYRPNITPSGFSQSLKSPSVTLELPPKPKTLEELLEFQWIHTAHFLMTQEATKEASFLIQKLHGLMIEKNKLQKELTSLTQEADFFDSTLKMAKEIAEMSKTDLLANDPVRVKSTIGNSDLQTNDNNSSFSNINANRLDSQVSQHSTTTVPLSTRMTNHHHNNNFTSNTVQSGLSAPINNTNLNSLTNTQTNNFSAKTTTNSSLNNILAATTSRLSSSSNLTLVNVSNQSNSSIISNNKNNNFVGGTLHRKNSMNHHQQQTILNDTEFPNPSISSNTTMVNQFQHHESSSGHQMSDASTSTDLLKSNKSTNNNNSSSIVPESYSHYLNKQLNSTSNVTAHNLPPTTGFRETDVTSRTSSSGYTSNSDLPPPPNSDPNHLNQILETEKNQPNHNQKQLLFKNMNNSNKSQVQSFQNDTSSSNNGQNHSHNLSRALRSSKTSSSMSNGQQPLNHNPNNHSSSSATNSFGPHNPQHSSSNQHYYSNKN